MKLNGPRIIAGLERLQKRLERKRVWLWLYNQRMSTEVDPAIFAWRAANKRQANLVSRS